MALRRAGALWKKKDKNGNTYLSGVFEPNGKGGEKYSVMIFTNQKRDDHPKDPDYSIQMSNDDESGTAPTPRAEPTVSDSDDVPF